MKTSPLLRASFLAAVLGASLSATAVPISLTSAGFDDYSNTPTIDESVLAQFGGYGPLDTLHYELSISPYAGYYEGPGGRLDFGFVVRSDVRDFDTSTETLSGNWTALGGTGTYAGAVGSGTFSTSINFLQFGPTPTSGRSLTTFVGSVQAVPEPASMLALGFGAATVLRRRKRA